MNSTAPRQLFTVQEASQRLPLVTSIVNDIVDLYEDVMDRRERLDRLKEGRGDKPADNVYSEELEQSEESLEKDLQKLEEYRLELEAIGAELKDPQQGLVDFRSQLEDREIYLCWKLGEEEIAHWHELEDGFESRQALIPQAHQE
ncbi:DUF2203 domain-containing protein [Planctomycetaceae bacterium]|nr:DUF2203 domain-containing protein [bacterium]MDC0274148.1 DUF2203 domain-containing protein [Planctomycetaceae bacterium]